MSKQKEKKKPIEMVPVTMMVRRSSIERKRLNLVAKRTKKAEEIASLGKDITEIDMQIAEYDRVLVVGKVAGE